MPACDVTVLVGKREKIVTVEFDRNVLGSLSIPRGQNSVSFETVGDLCAYLAMDLEPNADKIKHVGGLRATEKEIKAELAASEKRKPKTAEAEFVAADE